MRTDSLPRLALFTALALAPLAPAALRATTTNLDFAIPAEDAGERSRENFDAGWSFARFGLQPDGSRKPEPGVAAWSITASASSEESDNPAENAFDGDASSRWCASGATPAQWLALDLGRPVALGSVAVTWEKDSGYASVIEGSSDGRNWKQLTATDAKTKSGAVSKISGTFRHLRVRTTALPAGGWASISEIRLTDASGAPVVRERLAGNSPTAETPGFDDSAWRKLDLPHDWGIEGPFRNDLPGETGKLPWKGLGWYRKSFTLPSGDKGKRVFLDIDGAMAHAKMWINGKPLPAHPYGYTSFRVELTPYLNFGDTPNVVAVRLDTEKWDSRWYPGAGIYRHTWLVKTAPVHVAHYGTTLTTPKITAGSGEVNLAVRVRNQSEAPAGAVVRVDIHELDAVNKVGAKVASASGAALTVAAGATGESVVKVAVPRPKLWDIAAPNRYLARTVVSVAGKTVDSYDTPFGFRTLEFTARNGFKLNGKRVEVNGVCQHHDLGALGAALNDRALERQLEILKGMGCNSIRTSHNPPATELLDLADRMGFLVQVEAFDAWAHAKKPKDYNRLWKAWHETDLRDMVKRARNHPSVFMWSVGNEVVEQRDPAFPKELVAIVKSEDATRPVTAGCNDAGGAIASGFAKELDVMGVNYNLGIYDAYLKKPEFANKPVMSTESSSCVSSRGEYFFPVKRGADSRANFQISSYDVDAPGWACPPDDQFRVNDRHPAIFGEFVWTGWDYLGEPTPYNADTTNLLNFRGDAAKRAALEKELAELGKVSVPSRSSYFGIIDLAGFPKDRFYSYQSRWRADLPMVHVFPHWNWPERAGQVTPVHAYTAGDEAELFLNGKSLGKKKKNTGEYRFKWDEVKYAPGEIKVVAYKAGRKWAEQTVKTTGAPTKLALVPDRAAIAGDGKDLSFVTLRIVDAAGLTVPRTHNPIQFSVTGPGEIVATDNGDATSFESFQSPERKAFNGLALAIVRAKPGATGEIRLRAESPGLAPATTVIRAK